MDGLDGRIGCLRGAPSFPDLLRYCVTAAQALHEPLWLSARGAGPVPVVAETTAQETHDLACLSTRRYTIPTSPDHGSYMSARRAASEVSWTTAIGNSIPFLPTAPPFNGGGVLCIRRQPTTDNSTLWRKQPGELRRTSSPGQVVCAKRAETPAEATLEARERHISSELL